MIEHKKKFGVYYWDTFDNIISLRYEHDKKQKVIDYVIQYYSARFRDNGADRVEIVNNKGDIVRCFTIG